KAVLTVPLLSSPRVLITPMLPSSRNSSPQLCPEIFDAARFHEVLCSFRTHSEFRRAFVRARQKVSIQHHASDDLLGTSSPSVLQRRGGLREPLSGAL